MDQGEERGLSRIDFNTRTYREEIPGIDPEICISEVEPYESSDYSVVFSHGFTGNKDEGREGEEGLFKRLAERLGEQGVPSIRYDWRGIGGSGGKFHETNLEMHAKDLENIVDWAGEELYPGKKIHGIGLSLGATLFLSSMPERVDKYKLLSPVVCPKKDMGPRYDPTDAPITKGGVKVGRELIEDINEADLRENLKKVASDTLVVHSEDDEVIDFGNIKSYVNEMKEKPEFKTVSGASHTFRPRDKYVPILINYIQGGTGDVYGDKRT